MWIWAEHHEHVWKPARIVEVSERFLKVSFITGEVATISNKVRTDFLAFFVF